MARYRGPKHKLARREGINLLDKSSKSLQRRLNIIPGSHGRKRTKRLSEFGQQLREKQKAKAIYSILEKQFSLLVDKAQKKARVKKQDAGEVLLSLLETRLDNIVYRLGFAKTRFQARQFVSHGHVMLNGKKTTIPSYQTKEGDIVSLSEDMKKNIIISELLEEKPVLLPFLELKKEKGVGKLARLPKRSDLETLFDIRLIIEYYSR